MLRPSGRYFSRQSLKIADCHSFGQRSTTTFVWVKNSTAWAPCPWRSPKKLSFQPLKGKKRHGRRHADIDADVACGRFIAELAGGGSAAGEQAGHIAPGALVHEVNSVVDGVDLH
jgi:hypothetical protein